MTKTPGGPRGRKPTYGAAVRIVRLILGLYARPFGWSFEGILDDLGVAERTLHRYIATCNEELLDWNGNPLIEVIHRGDRRILRLADPARSPDSTAWEAASLYFTLTVMRFLEGTILGEGVEGLWERTYRSLPEKQRVRLARLERKFFSVPYAPKDYRAYDDQLDLILRALIDQYRLRVDYAGLEGEGHVHDFDPYTLAAHRGGLYVLGYSDLYEKIVWLAVERIRGLERIVGENGRPMRFTYPADYHPAKHTDGMFGVFEGEETRVELLLRGSEAFLRSRTIHPTQRFEQRPGVGTVLTMTVRGTTELRNWILGHGPWIEVLSPATLRAEVASLLTTAAAFY